MLDPLLDKSSGPPIGVQDANWKSNQVTVIEPISTRLMPDLFEAWRFRELFWTLVTRDLKLRYTQTVLGSIWVVLQPAITLLVLTLVFGMFARIPTKDVPYALVVFCGLIPYMFFSRAVSEGASSMVANAGLVKKVYFPRIMVPVASQVAATIDIGIAIIFLCLLMLFYRQPFTWHFASLPLFALAVFTLALGSTLWLAALSVRYRDIAMSIPIVLQMALYLSPVIYPAALVPEKWRWLYGMNPMVGIIEGFRWAVIGTSALTSAMLAVSVMVSVVLVISGAIYFKRFERIAPDVM
jgi:lipopolysaccharide transport system permease protein